MKKEEMLIEIIATIFELDKSNIELERERETYDEWDSLAHVQIASEISDRYNANIPFEQLSEIKYLKDFLKYMGE